MFQYFPVSCEFLQSGLQTSSMYVKVMWNYTFVKKSKSSGSLLFMVPEKLLSTVVGHRMDHLFRKSALKVKNHKNLAIFWTKGPIDMNVTSLS